MLIFQCFSHTFISKRLIGKEIYTQGIGDFLSNISIVKIKVRSQIQLSWNFSTSNVIISKKLLTKHSVYSNNLGTVLLLSFFHSFECITKSGERCLTGIINMRIFPLVGSLKNNGIIKNRHKQNFVYQQLLCIYNDHISFRFPLVKLLLIVKCIIG